VLLASVPSPDTGIDSIKSLGYEVIPFINWEAIASNKKDLEQDALNLCKDETEDLRENLQLEEELQVLLAEKDVMQLSMEELQKKLEISEAQCCSPPAR
jgi:hypothetical protein